MKKKYKNVLQKLKGKKILITGGLGFIGSSLAFKCVEQGARVTIFDCLDPNSGGNLYNIQGIRDRVELHYDDILHFDKVSKHIAGKDIIFNCAASTSHHFSMKEPWINIDVNVRGVINLLEAMRRFNKNVRFIQIGTTTQLGRLKYRPADEKHPEFPTDIYSANKSVAEKYALIYSTAYKMKVSVIRLSNVFGPRASIHSPDFTFNNYFIGLALQGKEITVFGDGRQLRNVIYIDDAVDALVLAASSDGANGKVFFAAGDKHYSVTDIAKETVKCIGLGKVVSAEWSPERRATEIGDAVISNQEIKSFLGWAPKYDLKTGLVKTKTYYQTCLEKYMR